MFNAKNERNEWRGEGEEGDDETGNVFPSPPPFGSPACQIFGVPTCAPLNPIIPPSPFFAGVPLIFSPRQSCGESLTDGRRRKWDRRKIEGEKRDRRDGASQWSTQWGGKKRGYCSRGIECAGRGRREREKKIPPFFTAWGRDLNKFAREGERRWTTYHLR